MRLPCQALKYGPCKDFAVESTKIQSKAEEKKNEFIKTKPSLVRSPFNMTSNLKSEIGDFT